MKTKQVMAVLALASAALVSGCVAHSRGYYNDGEAVYVDNPELVAVDDNTWVVRDYDRAVYFVGDSYWSYRQNSWYRSDYYDRGWTGVTINLVPRSIASRNHTNYVHYHGDARSRRRPASPVVRDTRYRRNPPGRRDPPGHRVPQRNVDRQRPAARPGDHGRGSPQSPPSRNDRRRDDKRDDKRDNHRDNQRDNKWNHDR